MIDVLLALQSISIGITIFCLVCTIFTAAAGGRNNDVTNLFMLLTFLWGAIAFAFHLATGV